MDMNLFRKYLQRSNTQKIKLAEEPNMSDHVLADAADDLVRQMKPDSVIKHYIEKELGVRATMHHTKDTGANEVSHTFEYATPTGTYRLKVRVSRTLNKSTAKKRSKYEISHDNRLVLDVYIEATADRHPAGRKTLKVERLKHVDGDRMKFSKLGTPQYWFPHAEVF